MKEIELTVLMALRNNKQFLRSAVLSLLAEAISSLQILIVDDGSTDGSASTVSDLPVEVLTLKESKGPAYAHNLGLRRALGRFVTIFDSDDLMAPGGLRRRLEYLRANPLEVSVVGEVAGVIDTRGCLLGDLKSIVLPRYRRPGAVISKEMLVPDFHFPAYIWLHMFQRGFLESIGGFDASLRCSHDNDLFHRVIGCGPIPFLPIPVAFYRLHEHNISGGLWDHKFEMSRIARAETLLTHLEHGVPFR